MTPPDLVLLSEFHGDWAEYEEALYQVFMADVVRHDLKFRGVDINARRLPEHERKWAGFWHLISEGRIEDERLPDLRRCERLRWVRWIVESADYCDDIDVWQNQRGRECNKLLWYNEEYLVVLSERNQNLLLKTAFCTEMPHRVLKLRKERDAPESKI